MLLNALKKYNINFILGDDHDLNKYKNFTTKYLICDTLLPSKPYKYTLFDSVSEKWVDYTTFNDVFSSIMQYLKKDCLIHIYDAGATQCISIIENYDK